MTLRVVRVRCSIREAANPAARGISASLMMAIWAWLMLDMQVFTCVYSVRK